MLSSSCRYAIRAVIYLASQPGEKGKTGIKKISQDLHLPTPFLAKILQQLAKQRILSSVKGPHGGFSLNKDPRAITLFDIIRTIDGDGIFTNCVIHNETCASVDKSRKECPIHDDYSAIRKLLIDLFRKRTIYDLAGIAKESDKIII